MTAPPLDPIHVRAGVESLEALHDRRRQLVSESARLTALYGPFGMWDAKRKQVLALCDLKVRDEALGREEKLTEAKVDTLAHAHPEYQAFLSRSVEEKAAWLVLENDLSDLNDRIRSRETELNFVRQEMGLR